MCVGLEEAFSSFRGVVEVCFHLNKGRQLFLQWNPPGEVGQVRDT